MRTISAVRPVTSLQAARFIEKYNEGGFPGRSFGLAFVNEFRLDREDPDVQQLLEEQDTIWASTLAYNYFVEI